MKKILPVVLLLCSSLASNAQDTLLRTLLLQNRSSFYPAGNSFTGNGWQKIDSACKASNYVLVGEDHFLNEVPFFVAAIARESKFDNFIAEIDPFSASLLQRSIQDKNNFSVWQKEFEQTFSFFAMPKEMELLQQMVNSNSRIMGTDQVLMNADRLLCSELKKITREKKAYRLYEKIETHSKLHFDSFQVNMQHPMYMLTQEFEQDVQSLLQLNISSKEKEQLHAMLLSRKIYLEQNHALRLQLMKDNMQNYYWHQLGGKKNLFKFGAVHLCKKEGLLGGYDIGNQVSQFAATRKERSLHIMIIGKAGMQGSPFKGFAAHPVDTKEGELKSLQPFMNEVKGEDWQCFDMAPLQQAINSGCLSIADKTLERMIEGYDYIVIIPTVTAASF